MNAKEANMLARASLENNKDVTRILNLIEQEAKEGGYFILLDEEPPARVTRYLESLGYSLSDEAGTLRIDWEDV